VEQQYRGRPIVTDAVTRAVLTLTVDSGSHGLVLAVTLDSVSVAGDAGIPPDEVAASVGHRFLAGLEPSGAVRTVTAPSGPASALADQLGSHMHDLVPTLPPGGAAPGAEWDDTTRMSGHTAGIPIAVETRASHRAAGWTDADGRSVLPLGTQVTYTFAGEGERAGQWVSMTGTGSGHRYRLLTEDGLAVLGIRADTLRVTIELPAVGLHIPLTQIRADTLRRLD